MRSRTSLVTLRSVFKLHSLPRTLPAAERDLRSRDAKVRLSALGDLTRFREEPDRSRAVASARAGLQDDDVEVRARAAIVLADLGAGHCTEDVLRLLGDAHVRVRQMALVSLGELAEPGDATIVGRLGAFLNVAEPALRFQALAAWARLAPERLLEALEERLTDSDPEVRALALRLAHEHWVDAAGALPVHLVDAVRARLEDSEPAVRLVAAVLLGRAGEPTDTKLLGLAVSRRVRAVEPIDEQDAIALCGELEIRAAIPALRRRAFGLWGVSRDPFAWQAKVALAQLGDAKARTSILSGLSARSWHVRALSADAAANARLTEALPRLEVLLGDPQLDRELVERAIERLRTGLIQPGVAPGVSAS